MCYITYLLVEQQVLLVEQQVCCIAHPFLQLVKQQVCCIAHPDAASATRIHLELPNNSRYITYEYNTFYRNIMFILYMNL